MESIDIVKLYNPANAASLTPDEILSLQKLDSDQIKILAKAYPNISMKRAYLLIIDSTKPADKQIPSLNTFENLWNLREKNGQRKWVAYQFHGTYQARTVNANSKPRRQEVVDLSETELMSLPGFKTADNGTMTGNFAAVTVPVTKVKREAVKPTVASKTETVNNPIIKQP